MMMHYQSANQPKGSEKKIPITKSNWNGLYWLRLEKKQKKNRKHGRNGNRARKWDFVVHVSPNIFHLCLYCIMHVCVCCVSECVYASLFFRVKNSLTCCEIRYNVCYDTWFFGSAAGHTKRMHKMFNLMCAFIYNKNFVNSMPKL